jgi:transposase
MLSFGNRRIFLCADRVDMRKGFSGLTGLVLSGLHQDPRGGDAFIFVGRSGKMLKVLVWDRDGFWCCAKKLARGTFVTPVVRGVSGNLTAVELQLSDWQLLLEGIVVQQKRQVPRVGR